MSFCEFIEFPCIYGDKIDCKDCEFYGMNLDEVHDFLINDMGGIGYE